MTSTTAVVRSRVKISSKELGHIKKTLGVNAVVNTVDDTFAGGIIIQIGDKVIDYSAASVLAGEKQGREYSVGEVLVTGDGVATVDGLSSVMAGEIVSFESGMEGLALSLGQDTVGIVAMGDADELKSGDRVTTTGRILSIPVGKNFLGRVIDPLGKPLDGKGDITPERFNPLERVAAGVMAREMVSEPLQTGIKAIDGMIPIGRGQRELIIGDRQTGKSSIALTTIMNQKGQHMTCVYVAIGQKRSSIAQMISILEEYDAMKHTIIVCASASDAPALQYLAPYAGCAVAEYFREQGQDALIVYDDLSKHAWAYRQLSLLLRRPSGREAYPGDIFYAHSRLLERACRLNKAHGGGSITALPIIETQAGDLSAYIPTNVISITDGQLYLESDLFNAGQRPAINVGNSVSRVGGAAQIKAIKQVAGRMRLDLAQYRELAAFAQFSSDLDLKTQQQLNRGAKLTELLKQGWEEPMPVERQVVSMWAATHGYMDDIPATLIKSFETHLLSYVAHHKQTIYKSILDEKKLTEQNEKELESCVKDAKQVFVSKEETTDGK